MRILSMFDGMACGMIAMLGCGVDVERYVAFEVDKYAVKTSSHNFPMIEHRGDVFQGDFTEFEGFDFLVGGSPCTYWSIAQTQNRETTASGLGWELFSQYVRALHEAKPKYFIYENNKSMSQAIRQSITETFGFEPICINSALVSAQNRQRLYWVGMRRADGTYKKVNISQPADRGIMLTDILETTICNPVGDTGGKSKTLKAQYQKNNETNFFDTGSTFGATGVAERIPSYGEEEKSRPVESTYPKHSGCSEGSLEGRLFSDNPSKQQVDLIAEPIRVGTMPNSDGDISTSQSARVFSTDGKSVTLTGCGGAGAKTGLYAEALVVKEGTKKGYTEIEVGNCVDMKHENSKTRKGRNMEDKANCLDATSRFYQYLGTTKHPVYEVKDGMISVKGKEYPIRLVDGFYIIRKLSVTECMRLQTVPQWYEFPVSNTQAYKMLGNGWTIEVIKHLIRSALEDDGSEKYELDDGEQLDGQTDIFDFI